MRGALRRVGSRQRAPRFNDDAAASADDIQPTMQRMDQLVSGVELGGETRSQRDAARIRTLESTVQALQARVQALEALEARVVSLESAVAAGSSAASGAAAAPSPDATATSEPDLTLTPVCQAEHWLLEALAAFEASASDQHRAAQLEPEVERRASAFAQARLAELRQGDAASLPSTDDYWSQESLYRVLTAPAASGALTPVRLVRISWLLVRAQQVMLATTSEEVGRAIMPRRQQLEAEEPDAFISVDELRALVPADGKPPGKTQIAALS